MAARLKGQRGQHCSPACNERAAATARAGGRLSPGWRGPRRPGSGRSAPDAPPARRGRPSGPWTAAGPRRLARCIPAALGDARPPRPRPPPALTPPPDPSPLTSPRAPHSPCRGGRAPPPWPPPCCAPPQLSQPGARGRGSLPLSLTPHTLRGAPGGGSAGRRGRPRALLRPGGAGGGGPGGSLRAGGGGRTRQAASPLKAATTSPARGSSAHAPRACARPRVPASRPPFPPRRRSGVSSGPGWVAAPGRRGPGGIGGGRGGPSTGIPRRAWGGRCEARPRTRQALAGLEWPHGSHRACDLVAWPPGPACGGERLW